MDESTIEITQEKREMIMNNDFFDSKKPDKELLDLFAMNFVEDEVRKLLCLRIFASSTVRQIESFYNLVHDEGADKLFEDTCYRRNYIEIVFLLEQALKLAKDLEASVSKDLNGKYNPVEIFTDVYSEESIEK